MNQSTISVLRQIGAILVSVYGVLTSTVHPLHLPVAVSSVLVAFGPAILLLEHYLGDPSTGSSTTTTPVAQKQTAPVPVQLVQQVPVPVPVSAGTPAQGSVVVSGGGANPAPPAP